MNAPHEFEKNRALTEQLLNAATETRADLQRALQTHNGETHEFVATLRDANCRTVAHFAAACNRVDVLEYLQCISVDFDALQDKDGCTPFHIAAATNSDDAAIFLFKAGCSLWTLDKRNVSVLQQALISCMGFCKRQFNCSIPYNDCFMRLSAVGSVLLSMLLACELDDIAGTVRRFPDHFLTHELHISAHTELPAMILVASASSESGVLGVLNEYLNRIHPDVLIGVEDRDRNNVLLNAVQSNNTDCVDFCLQKLPADVVSYALSSRFPCAASIVSQASPQMRSKLANFPCSEFDLSASLNHPDRVKRIQRLKEKLSQWPSEGFNDLHVAEEFVNATLKIKDLTALQLAPSTAKLMERLARQLFERCEARGFTDILPELKPFCNYQRTSA